MDVRPVLTAADQALAAVEARDADLTAALGQLATWDRQGLRVPRIVVGIDAAPDPARIEAELGAFDIQGARLALALPEAGLDAGGMRDALGAVRARTGAVAIVADFGGGEHPHIEFLVDYPADALALSARIAAGAAERDEVAERVRETCRVAAELGWRVIAADVASEAERRALAAAGVAEVAGPGIAPFEAPGNLSTLLSRLKVEIPAVPEPSARQVPEPEPESRPAPARERPAPAAAQTASPWTPERSVKRDPIVASRLPRQPDNRGAALPSGMRGSPGRSRPARGADGDRPRPARRVVAFLFLLLLLAAIAYVVLAYLGHVPDPLGIEDIEI